MCLNYVNVCVASSELPTYTYIYSHKVVLEIS
jgi:hypothetical protein